MIFSCSGDIGLTLARMEKRLTTVEAIAPGLLCFLAESTGMQAPSLHCDLLDITKSRGAGAGNLCLIETIHLPLGRKKNSPLVLFLREEGCLTYLQWKSKTRVVCDCKHGLQASGL